MALSFGFRSFAWLTLAKALPGLAGFFLPRTGDSWESRPCRPGGGHCGPLAVRSVRGRVPIWGRPGRKPRTACRSAAAGANRNFCLFAALRPSADCARPGGNDCRHIIATRLPRRGSSPRPPGGRLAQGKLSTSLGGHPAPGRDGPAWPGFFFVFFVQFCSCLLFLRDREVCVACPRHSCRGGRPALPLRGPPPPGLPPGPGLFPWRSAPAEVVGERARVRRGGDIGRAPRALPWGCQLVAHKLAPQTADRHGRPSMGHPSHADPLLRIKVTW